MGKCIVSISNKIQRYTVYIWKLLYMFPDINKLCNVASCWIYEYIRIVLGARPILHISRIKVKITSRLILLRKIKSPENSVEKTKNT
jgi:hypothetical protein